MTTGETRLRVGIVGCGLIGNKRADALHDDVLVATFDTDDHAAATLAQRFGSVACEDLDELLSLDLDVVVVATVHRYLSELSCRALAAGANVLVEKPGGIGVAEIDAIAEAARRVDRVVKVGFNHRFHPGTAQAIREARSGRYGPVLSLRARYGHGGRLGYENEWRSDPSISGGGELVDQGMHLLDLSYWLLGDLPLHSSLLRSQFWSRRVDDNAVIILGSPKGVGDDSPFALLHASWTEWQNLFSLEITCRTAKFAVDGLVRSYGAQVLRIFRMGPEMGPPQVEELTFPDVDTTWTEEWKNFRLALLSRDPTLLLGDLESARYAWSCVEQAQRG